MKRLVTTFLILLVSLSAFAGSGKTYTLSDYEKLEIQIPMRDIPILQSSSPALLMAWGLTVRVSGATSTKTAPGQTL